ncbi:hypothetical protein LCGC14_1560620 [marine sediment metagenome]|uniref:Uncharacterized protein n=1 Tax=marine sediment metagenome TaxID=412755 RepID=A0A0F9LNC8_9ZZZZ
MGIASKDVRLGPMTPVANSDLFSAIGNHFTVTNLAAAVIIAPGGFLPEDADDADKVKIQAHTQDVRITYSADSTPTAIFGFLIRTTDEEKTITLRGITLKAIEVVGGAALQVQFGA